MITRYKADMAVRFDDHDLDIALFLYKNPGWRPEDFGYPKGDYILFDLLRLLSA